jgi:hypothetical protein
MARNSPPSLMFFLGSAGLGAALMYFYDPDAGRLRRALLNERYANTVRRIEEARRITLRDVSTRAHGLADETRRLVKEDPARGLVGGLGALFAFAAMLRGGIRGLLFGAIGSSLLARAVKTRPLGSERVGADGTGEARPEAIGQSPMH